MKKAEILMVALLAASMAGCEERSDDDDRDTPPVEAAFAGMARFEEVVEDRSAEWTFTADRTAAGLEVRYLTHSQSLTNIRGNRITVEVSVNGRRRGKQTDLFDSQTEWGTMTGFWHSLTFEDAHVVPGDVVTIAMKVDAGDYRAYVSTTEVWAAEP